MDLTFNNSFLKKRNHIVLTFAFLFLFQYASFGQQRSISGVISDLHGLQLPGVNILVKGTTEGTQSDINGSYTIQVASGQVLIFSFVGFNTQEIVVGSEETMNILMKEYVAALDEVLIIGYGEQSKRKLTDNIVKLTSSDIENVPTASVFSAIAGKAAGVQIGQTNGKIEGGLIFKIRGQASLSANSAPLYVLDGIPLINSNESNNGAATNPLMTLSANEIESIDILKDASSSAIYGARGANGVVVITTKRGKEGKTKFNVNFSSGVSEPSSTNDYLNAEQYIELILEAAQRSPLGDLTDFVTGQFDIMSNGTWQDRTYDTNWQDHALINGYVRDMDFSLSGGDDKTTFFFSGAYNDTKGIVDGNELDRVSARVNVNHKFSNRFTAGINLGYSRTNIDRVNRDGAFTNPVSAVANAPISPAFIDGEPFKNAITPNYLIEDKYAFYNTKVRRVTGKVFGEYRILDWLKLNSDLAYDLYAQTEDQFRGSKTIFQSTNGEAFAADVTIENYIFSNYATFDKTFNSIHDLSVVVGMELNESNRRSTSLRGTEFPSDDFQTIDNAASITFGSGNTTAYSFVSYFARATYALSDKYLVKASLRRDGSSRFGEASQFGTFPALSGGWILSEEGFMKNLKVFSFLKLRASWGIVGNAEIGNFASLGLFGAVSYDQLPGIEPTQAANENLSWEESSQIDIAIEHGLFNNRITGEIAYYVKNSDELIFNQPLIPSSGDPNGNGINKNIGRLKSNGIEITIKTNNIETDNFSWITNFNLGQNKSKIIDLPNGQDVVGFFNVLREGEAIDAFYLKEYAGVNPENGDALYYLNTDNGNGNLDRSTTNNPNDAKRIIAGQPNPEWIGGMTNSLTYKNFELNFTFQGQWGADIYNFGGSVESVNANGFDNQTIDQLRRWQSPGDITDVPEARFSGNNGNAWSTRYLHNADFIRLRNLILGYNVPKRLLNKIGFDQCRIYLSGLNLFTITNYEGYDPGSFEDVDRLKAPGATFFSAPPARTFALGVNISF